MSKRTIQLQITSYTEDKGITLDWEEGFEIFVKTDLDSVIIKANSAGLISLAKHLLVLAQQEVAPHYHIHLDDSNSLETASSELVIEKI